MGDAGRGAEIDGRNSEVGMKVAVARSIIASGCTVRFFLGSAPNGPGSQAPSVPLTWRPAGMRGTRIHALGYLHDLPLVPAEGFEPPTP